MGTGAFFLVLVGGREDFATDKRHKSEGGWRLWKRWHIFLINLLWTSTFPFSWTKTCFCFPWKFTPKCLLWQIERRKQKTLNVFWVFQHLWIGIVFSLLYNKTTFLVPFLFSLPSRQPRDAHSSRAVASERGVVWRGLLLLNPLS